MVIDKEKYSFSKLSAFETCRQMFRKTYIEHIKGVGNCFSSYGSELHSIMERLAKGELSLENIVDVYDWEFDAAVPEDFPDSKFCPNMRELYYKQGRNFLQNCSGFGDKKVLEVEAKFDMPIDDWIFNGIIDLVYEDNEGRLVLQDYKSKSSFKSKKEQAEYARQLYLYSLYIKEKYGKYPDLLRFSMFRKNTIVDIPFSESSLAEALEWACNTVKEIRSCWDYTPNCEDFFCNNLCNHRDTCEFKK